LDNLNSYYDPALKRARLAELAPYPAFRFEQGDLADRDRSAVLFATYQCPLVIHLAGQPGVRHSLNDPHAFLDSNLAGFLNVLEGCRRSRCRHLIYASSSSVYGGNTTAPSRVTENVDHPLNLYGATKKANELMAHAYAHLFAIPMTGLRFFTVYGPWGRPDMAIWLFTEAILNEKPIQLFNQGQMRRSFTYIDDVAKAIADLADQPATPDAEWTGMKPSPASSMAPWRVHNVGNRSPTEVNYLVRLIEEVTGRSAVRNMLPMQPGEMLETYADTADLQAVIEFSTTPIEEGVRRFVDWYRGYVGRL
jgi:UDP-glucuronate 4-epimerase